MHTRKDVRLPLALLCRFVCVTVSAAVCYIVCCSECCTVKQFDVVRSINLALQLGIRKHILARRIYIHTHVYMYV